MQYPSLLDELKSRTIKRVNGNLTSGVSILFRRKSLRIETSEKTYNFSNIDQITVQHKRATATTVDGINCFIELAIPIQSTHKANQK